MASVQALPRKAQGGDASWPGTQQDGHCGFVGWPWPQTQPGSEAVALAGGGCRFSQEAGRGWQLWQLACPRCAHEPSRVLTVALELALAPPSGVERRAQRGQGPALRHTAHTGGPRIGVTCCFCRGPAGDLVAAPFFLRSKLGTSSYPLKEYSSVALSTCCVAPTAPSPAPKHLHPPGGAPCTRSWHPSPQPPTLQAAFGPDARGCQWDPCLCPLHLGILLSDPRFTQAAAGPELPSLRCRALHGVDSPPL